MSKFAIVGAGFGGLALALRLSHLGHEVHVFEKNDFVGGRCHAITVGNCHFDGGPTLLMMLEPFRKLFSDVGESFDIAFDLKLCDPNYRVTFGDGSHIDCTNDQALMVSHIEVFSNAKEAQSFKEMLCDLEKLYVKAIPMFVRRNYDSCLPLLSPFAAYTAIRYGMLWNLANMMKKRFEDPRLQILFCLQTMYLGLSPEEAPSVYSVLTYMEYGEGIRYPKGGLHSIASTMADMAKRRGAAIHLNAAVKRINGHRMELESGEVVEADAVICNADLPYAEKSLVQSDVTFTDVGSLMNEYVSKILPKRKRRSSCSALNIYMDYAGELPKLLHHNIILGGDFSKNLRQIFKDFEIPEDPSFYAAISSKADQDQAPKGHENLYLLIPCPNLDHNWTDEEESKLADKAISRLEKDFNLDRNKIEAMKRIGPRDWQAKFNLDKGATFGLSHDFFQSVCFRPSNKSKESPGLYFVGASTVPGNGLPMTLISAELVMKRLADVRLI